MILGVCRCTSGTPVQICPMVRYASHRAVVGAWTAGQRTHLLCTCWRTGQKQLTSRLKQPPESGILPGADLNAAVAEAAVLRKEAASVPGQGACCTRPKSALT